MKLVLTESGPWPIHRLDEGGADARDDPAILVGPLELALGSQQQWMERVAGWERPPFGTAEIVRHMTIRTQLRWRGEMVESRITAGMDVLERRLSIVYDLLEWRAAVVFRASPARFVADVKRAERVLLSGRPDWQGDSVVALAQLCAE